MKPKKVLEKHIEARVIAYCKKHKLYTRKFASPSNRSVPDRVIVGPKGTLFLELKKPKGKPTPAQLHELNLIHKAGGHQAWSDNSEGATAIIDLVCISGKTYEVVIDTAVYCKSPGLSKEDQAFRDRMLRMIEEAEIDCRPGAEFV